ncbi:MAG: hypothetical protein WA581_18460 [Candidatus Acidiferrales bacterium]
MQKRAPAPRFFAFGIACALILAACGGGSGTSTVTSVAITPTSASVPINGTAEFTATVNLTSSNSVTSTSTVVTWEVDGVAGGSSATGTIVASTTDEQVGIYTAPGVVPSTNNGQVNITAVAPQNPSSTTSTTSSTTITSNTVVVTIGAGNGLAITEQTTTPVPAGSPRQFAATLNGLNDPNATWSVSSANGGDVGTINALSGYYVAPEFPPPGGTVTITATDPTVPAPVTATVQIVYSNHSLNGPFAFSYSGNDSDGFMAAAGSFVADGGGNITSGIEDIDSFLLGVSTGVSFTGTYVVGPDGRTTATVDTGHGVATWQFALTTNQHAVMIRFDSNKVGSGSGTIDQQNLNDLTTSPTVVMGPYAFSASGTDGSFKPMALAGEFTSTGSNVLTASGSMVDVNDGGSVTTESPSVNGGYTLDTANSGTGRGTLTLPSTTASQLQFAFYVIDSTHLHIIEIDGNDFLAGDMYTGAGSGASFAGTYVFTAGGTSTTGVGGAYAEGGVFVSDGSSITGGALDTNDAGTVTTNATVSTGAFSVNGATGRIDLTLSGSSEFAAYQTAEGTAVMVELDSAGISTGLAYSQVTADADVAPTPGSFAFLLGGQGMFHEVSGSAQPDTEGQLDLDGAAISGGNFDINNFNATYKSDPVNTTNSTVTAPGTNGRGTAVLEGENPDVTYNLVYYLIDGNTALLFDQDATRVGIGSIARQF